MLQREFAQNTPNLCILGSFISDVNHPIAIPNFAKKHPKRQAHIRIPRQCENPPGSYLAHCTFCYLKKTHTELSFFAKIFQCQTFSFWPKFRWIRAIKRTANNLTQDFFFQTSSIILLLHHPKCLRGNCTPDQKLACFVLFCALFQKQIVQETQKWH